MTNKIVKEYEFKDFLSSIEFVNKIAKIAEELNHHPNIYIHDYKSVRVEIYTHEVNDLTDKDYKLASEIENIYTK